MRQEIGSVDKMVEQSVKAGQFGSREDCASAMLNWLVLNQYVNPSRLAHPPGRRGPESGESIDDRAAEGVSVAEEALLQYEILRDRDA